MLKGKTCSRCGTTGYRFLFAGVCLACTLAEIKTLQAKDKKEKEQNQK